MSTGTSLGNQPTFPTQDPPFVLNFDCGDGVPALVTQPRESGERIYRRPDDQLPQISAGVFALIATIFGQLLIALVVALGGNPVVGIVAALTLLACGLCLVVAHAINQQGNQHSNNQTNQHSNQSTQR